MSRWSAAPVVLLLVSFFTGPGDTTGAEIAKDAESTQPLGRDAPVPDVSVQDVEGKAVSLARLVQGQPTVIVFFRGGWCPFCTRHTQELINAYPAIKRRGADLIAISPDSPQRTTDNRTQQAIPFPIYSDADVAAAKAFGLAFRVDEPTLQKYQRLGIDLEAASGRDHHSLPVPAVFITDRSGKIRFAHSDPDYRERLDTAVMLEKLGP